MPNVELSFLALPVTQCKNLVLCCATGDWHLFTHRQRDRSHFVQKVRVSTTALRYTVNLPMMKVWKKKIGSAETFERSPRCRIARDSRIWPQNRSQITVRGRKSSFTIFYLHLPPFYLHLVPSLVAKCTGKRPQKTPKLAVKWPGSAGREQSARAPGIGWPRRIFHWAREIFTHPMKYKKVTRVSQSLERF